MTGFGAHFGTGRGAGHTPAELAALLGDPYADPDRRSWAVAHSLAALDSDNPRPAFDVARRLYHRSYAGQTHADTARPVSQTSRFYNACLSRLADWSRQAWELRTEELHKRFGVQPGTVEPARELNAAVRAVMLTGGAVFTDPDTYREHVNAVLPRALCLEAAYRTSRDPLDALGAAVGFYHVVADIAQPCGFDDPEQLAGYLRWQPNAWEQLFAVMLDTPELLSPDMPVDPDGTRRRALCWAVCRRLPFAVAA